MASIQLKVFSSTPGHFRDLAMSRLDHQICPGGAGISLQMSHGRRDVGFFSPGADGPQARDSSCIRRRKITVVGSIHPNSADLQDTPILTSLWQATSNNDNDAIDRRPTVETCTGDPEEPPLEIRLEM